MAYFPSYTLMTFASLLIHHPFQSRIKNRKFLVLCKGYYHRMTDLLAGLSEENSQNMIWAK